MRALPFLLFASCLSLTRDFPETNPEGLCGNGVPDGNETGIDCGGGTCVACGPGQGCASNDDCLSGICDGGSCAATRCDDGKQGARESDVDCGLECAPCEIDQICSSTPDCAYARCLSSRCEAQTQSFTGRGGSVAIFGALIAAASGQDIVIWVRGATSYAERARFTSVATALTMSDDGLFAGVPGLTGGGRVHVYGNPEILANGASPVVALGPSGGTGGDRFGEALALASTSLVVAAPGSGQTYVFTRGSSGWTEQRAIATPGVSSVAIARTTIAVGAPPSVRVLVRQGIDWPEQQTISAPAGSTSFGASVALLDDQLLVGAAGKAHLYTRSGTTWTLTHTFTGEPAATLAVRKVALARGIVISGDSNAVHLHYDRGALGWLYSQSFAQSAEALAGTESVLALGTASDVVVFGAP